MKIDNKRNILENAHIIQNEETYYQFAGLKYNPAIIQETSKLKIQGCRLFWILWTPRELFLSSLESLAEDKTKGLERELHELRNTKLVDKRYRIEDNYVNWATGDNLTQ
jgi:hypothetical protein